MFTPQQTAAAALIFNGYRLAATVIPCPHDYHLAMPSSVPVFRQLAAYMARYNNELADLEAWAPYELFYDTHGLAGVAVAPWLRGGCRYLQATLVDNIHLAAPENVPAGLWFDGIDALASPLDQATRDWLDAVRQHWDITYGNMPTARYETVIQYDGLVAFASNLLGLTTRPNQIAALRRKKDLQLATI